MKIVGVVVLPLAALAVAATALSARPGSNPAPSPEAALTRSAAGSTGRSSDRMLPVPGGSNPTASPVPRGRWTWPLQPQPAVMRPFVRPATPYGAGHRGVDLAGAAGQEVRAVDAGVVTHVGTIAGRGTVSVLHASGVRSTYEPVDPVVQTGSGVARGAVLGRLEDTGSHCAPAPCLHLGAVRDDAYLDPLAFLLGGQRVRLLPLAG